MAQRRPLSAVPLVSAMVVGAAVAGVIGWRLNLQALEERVKDKRSALKKLVLSGRIPPNTDVVSYLTSRQTAIEQRYQHWVALIAPPPIAEAASADPQLYFQEQFHEVQRTLERLAAARSSVEPEQLGFPKELPPSDTVPRLLVQLSLIREAAALIFEQGVTRLSSFKIEDPQSVPGDPEEAPFLMRLPVQVRLSATLPQLLKVLGAIQRTSPLIDVRAIRMASAATPTEPVGGTQTGSLSTAKGQPEPASATVPKPSPESDMLDVELMLARYLVRASPEPMSEEKVSSPDRAAKKKGTGSGSVPSSPRAKKGPRSGKDSAAPSSDTAPEEP